MHVRHSVAGDVCIMHRPFFVLALGMIVDLDEIRKLAIERRDENVQFKEQLKSIPLKAVDEHVARINSEVSSAIDCTKCGNCCKVLEPPVDDDEVKRLAELKQLNAVEFKQNYTEEEPGTSIRYMKCQPCIFLQENACSIYIHRPASCADYPHLTQPNFKYRWKSILVNYALCPIVFNVVEKLKEEISRLKS